MSAGPGQDVYRNDAVGETLIVHPMAPGGAVLRAELLVDAVHHAPPAHVHPRSTESFTVIEGALAVRVGRRRWTLRGSDCWRISSPSIAPRAGW